MAMTSAFSAHIIEAVRSVVGDAPSIQLHVPDIGAEEKEFVVDCLDSTFVSSVGPYVTRIEQDIAAFTGAKHAIAVSNGTVALQVALTLAGVEPGDEVLVPALSFVATANSVVHAGAVPHFVDSSIATLGLDPVILRDVLESLEQRDGSLFNKETGRRVSAIAPMHTLGHPVDIEEIIALGEKYGIPVVEDAAESLGSFVLTSAGPKHTGTFGLLGILSFNGNKIITTGGGGIILTNDDELARQAKHLTTTAKLPHAWEFEHDEVAWNFRMPNINAALGVAQLTKLDSYLTRKRKLAQRYAHAFQGMAGVTFLTEPAGTQSNYWLNAIKVDGGIETRNSVLQAAVDDGLQARPFWNLLNEQRMYRSNPATELPVARELHGSVICLPSSPALTGSN
jgi:perosamine synthetase